MHIAEGFLPPAHALGWTLARMGYSSARRSLSSSGDLAAAVLTRSWDRARRMQEGLAGRGMETGLRVLPEVLPSSRAFVAASLLGLAAIVSVSLLIPGAVPR